MSKCHTSINSSSLLRTLLSGRVSTIRLEAPSGKSHSYVVKRPKNASFPKDVRFIYALHDDSQEFYIGMLEQGAFRLTRNSRFARETEIVKGAEYLVKCANNPSYFDNSVMKMYFDSCCCLCGRKLTSPKWVEVGYGPRCKSLVKEVCQC